MRAMRKRETAATLLIVAIVVFTTGCTTVTPAKIEPLEDQVGTLFGQVEFELQLNDIVLLNPYLDAESPRVDEFEAARLELTAAAELLVGYSMDVIELARLTSCSEAVADFVPLIRGLYSNLSESPIVEPHLTGVDVEPILANVAQQPNLTRALRAAAPINTRIATALRNAIADANDRFDLAFDETYDKIIDENRPFMKYTDNIIRRRNEILDKLLLLDDARQGDGAAWQALLDEDEELRRAVGGAVEMTNASIDQAESTLVERLAKLMEIWGHLEPSWTNYQVTLRELYAVDADVRNILRLAKFVIEEWDKAQRQMAKGRPAAFVRATQDLVYLALRRAAR